MLKIEYVNIDELLPYTNNAKVHTQEQIDQIKRSIKDFGFNDPISVWKNNEVIEGHGRLIAGKELGLEKVPIIRLDELTDEKRKAYMLVHNKLTLNTNLDMELVNIELNEISLDMEPYGFELLGNELLDDSIDDEFKEFDENIETKTRCPKCGYEW